MVTIDADGYIKICDRVKDLIKSGGEWISSVDVENALVAHPAVGEAAVVAVPHVKWQGRPLAVVVLKKDANASREELRSFLAATFAKWQLPDEFVLFPSCPIRRPASYRRQNCGAGSKTGTGEGRGSYLGAPRNRLRIFATIVNSGSTTFEISYSMPWPSRRLAPRSSNP